MTHVIDGIQVDQVKESYEMALDSIYGELSRMQPYEIDPVHQEEGDGEIRAVPVYVQIKNED